MAQGCPRGPGVKKHLLLILQSGQSTFIRLSVKPQSIVPILTVNKA